MVINISINLNSNYQIIGGFLIGANVNLSNTNLSDFDLSNSNRYTLKISRPKEAVGRIAINLINIYSLCDIKNDQLITDNKEKSYFILDYDVLLSNNDILNIINQFTGKNYDFLIKSSSSGFASQAAKNIRLFFTFDDLFDFISISKFSDLTIFEDNIEPNIIDNYKLYTYNLIKIKKEAFDKNKILGILL